MAIPRNLLETAIFLQVLIGLVVYIYGAFGGEELIISSIEQCRSHPNTDLTFEEMVVDRPEKDFYVVTGVIHVMREITGPFAVSLKIEKCTRESSDDCSYFYEYKADDYCTESKKEGSLLMSYIKFLGIKEGCPLKEERYPMNNLSFKVDPMVKKSFKLGKYWLGTLRAFRGDHIVMCQTMEGHVKSETTFSNSRYG